MTEIPAYWQNYIDGAWTDGGAGRLQVDDPGTGAPLAEQAVADAGDVDRAVQAAKRCHESGALSDMRPIERGRIVQAMADYFRANADRIAPVLTREQGKPLWEARIEVEGTAKYFEYYGNQAATVEGRSIPLGAGYFDFTALEPYGVSAQIIPWNYPLEVAARSIAAALATGNAVVVKTPELDPLTSRHFALAAEAAGLPKGALNLICGHGHEAGAALTRVTSCSVPCTTPADNCPEFSSGMTCWSSTIRASAFVMTCVSPRPTSMRTLRSLSEG